MWQVQVGQPKKSQWPEGIPDWAKSRIGHPCVKSDTDPTPIEFNTRKEAREYAKNRVNYYWNFRVRQV